MEFETPAVYRIAEETVNVTVIITGAEPRPRYPRASQVWRPERLAIRWTRQSSGDGWTPWYATARVVGPWVKKDGTAMAKDPVSDSLWSGDGDPETERFLAEVEKTRPTHAGAALSPID